MTCRPLSPHARRGVLILGRRVAGALAARALDPASGLPLSVRAALAGLVLAVDEEAHRRAGVEPLGPELRARLTAALPTTPQPRPP